MIYEAKVSVIIDAPSANLKTQKLSLNGQKVLQDMNRKLMINNFVRPKDVRQQSDTKTSICTSPSQIIALFIPGLPYPVNNGIIKRKRNSQTLD